MPKLQVDFGRSHFDVLPNELVCKIMIDMSLKDRQHLVEAHPRFLKLAQSSGLKTRVLTRSDKFTERKDLEKVLDPESTNIQVNSLHRSHRLLWYNLCCNNYNSLMNLNVFHLMPNLKQVTFKRCELWGARCHCQAECVFTFFDCKLWQMLLTKVRCLEFDNCSHGKQSKDTIDNLSTFLSWGNFIQKVFLNSNSDISLQEVTMRNFLTQRDFEKLMLELVPWILTSRQAGSEETRMEIKNHKREFIDIAPIIFASGEILELYTCIRRLELCLEALRMTLRWPEYSLEDESNKCKMFDMRKDGRGVLKTTLTEDFDMAALRRELSARLGGGLRWYEFLGYC